MVKNRILLIVIFCFLLYSCAFDGYLVGKYIYDKNGVKETIEINRDNTYIHSFEYQGKQKKQNGTWKAEYNYLLFKTGDRLIFYDFEEYYDHYLNRIIIDSIPGPVNMPWSCEMLMLNADNYEENLYR